MKFLMKRKWLNGFLVASWFIGLTLLLSGCGQGTDENQGKEPLVIGMELAYRPFEMTDANNQPSGISVEMAKALGNYLQRPIQIENIPYDGLIPSLRTGRIDLIISSMTRTPERAEAIDFSDPYVQTGLCLLVNQDSPVQSFEDLKGSGRKLAVKQGTTGHLYAKDRIASENLLVLDQEEAAVLEVVQGKADAFAYDQMSIYRHWQRNPDTTRALLDPFRAETWAIGIAKGREELLESVNDFLESYRAEGEFDRLANDYLPEEKAAFEKLGYPFLF